MKSYFLGFTANGDLWKDWFWEVQLFAIVRNVEDGITFFEFKMNWDKFESEHTPAFQVELTMFNCYNHLWIYNTRPLTIK